MFIHADSGISGYGTLHISIVPEQQETEKRVANVHNQEWGFEVVLANGRLDRKHFQVEKWTRQRMKITTSDKSLVHFSIFSQAVVVLNQCQWFLSRTSQITADHTKVTKNLNILLVHEICVRTFWVSIHMLHDFQQNGSQSSIADWSVAWMTMMTMMALTIKPMMTIMIYHDDADAAAAAAAAAAHDDDDDAADDDDNGDDDDDDDDDGR